VFSACECGKQSGHLVRSSMEQAMSSVVVEALMLIGCGRDVSFFDALQLRL
jgi:hypothetical protein